MKPLVTTPEPFPPIVAAAPAPKLDLPPIAGGTIVTLTKPPAVDTLPAAAMSPARTDYDVDIHDPKPKETYDTISKQHYGDAKYGASLKAFNRGLDLGQGVAVQVPPIYVLRKQYGQMITRPTGTDRGLDWTPPPGGK